MESTVRHSVPYPIDLLDSGRRDMYITPNATRVLRGSGTILLVDDEVTVLRATSRSLRCLGYDVIQARRGDEALAIYRAKGDAIDLVILDMIMPEKNGSVVLGELKEIDPGVKVLLSTGYNVEEEATKALLSGCEGVLRKPFSLSELSEAVDTILGASDICEEKASPPDGTSSGE